MGATFMRLPISLAMALLAVSASVDPTPLPLWNPRPHVGHLE